MNLKPIIRKIYLGAEKTYDTLYLSQYNKEIPVVFELFNADGSKHILKDSEVAHIEISINETSIFKITDIEKMDNKLSANFDREIMLEDGTGILSIYVSDGEAIVSNSPIPVTIDAGAIDEDLNPKISALLISDLQDYITEAVQVDQAIKDTVAETEPKMSQITELTTKALAEANNLNTKITTAKILDNNLETKIDTAELLNNNLTTAITDANTVKPELVTATENANSALSALESAITASSLNSYVLRAELIDAIYPVGSIYTTVNDVNPAQLFPGTTWKKISGYLVSGEEFGNIGKEIGSKTHSHDGSSLKALIGAVNSNTGTIGYKAVPTNSGQERFTMAIQATRGIPASSITKDNHDTAISGYTGEASTLPPSIVVGIWQRVSNKTAPIIRSFSVDKISAPAGSEVTFTAVASGEGTLKYKFIVKGRTTNYSIVRDFSTQDTFVWTPKVADEVHDCYVQVMDENSVISESNPILFTSTAEVVIDRPIKIESFTTSVTGSQVKNTPVQINVVGSGGEGILKYKFLLYDRASNIWYKLRDFESTNIYTWTPSKVGTKELYVDVKDANDNVVRSNPISIIITEPVEELSVTLTADPAIRQTVGNKVALTANATGGVGTLLYKFLLKNNDTNEFYLIKDYSTLDAVSWTASKSGTRTFYVDVKDEANNTVRASIENYTIE